MPYDPLLVQPMREELTQAGFTELHTPQEVDAALSQNGVSLLVINSVCGCAAGSLRPGVVASLENDKKPDNLFTVFAGQDTEATQHVRDTFLAGNPPSSPSVALFNNGTLIGMIHRYQIEGRFPEAIAQALKGAYDEFCVTTADAA